MWTKPNAFHIEYIQFEYLTRTLLRLPWHSLCMLLFARDILWMNDKSHVSTTYDNDYDADCWQIEETQPRINVSSAHKWLDIGNKNHTSVYDVWRSAHGSVVNMHWRLQLCTILSEIVHIAMRNGDKMRWSLAFGLGM